MEITFRKFNYELEFSEKQLYEIFDYFNNCFFYQNDKKRFYEGGMMGFLKSNIMEIIPDIWTPKYTRKSNTYTISNKMIKIINEKEKEGFEIHHFHSHLSDLSFPSPDDPYCVFESIGIVSLGNSLYNDFRIFRQLDYCSYPPLLGNIKLEEKVSTLVRFYKNERRIDFLPIEDEVKIEVADMPFCRDW